MSFLTNIQALITAIGGDVKRSGRVPTADPDGLYLINKSGGVVSTIAARPASPVVGTTYGPSYTETGWDWAEVPVPPPLDSFVPGWAFFGMSQIVDVLQATGTTVHAAVSCGPETPTVGTTVFEQSAGNTGDVNVPAAPGWTGTNWQIRRASDAPTPPTVGNNIGRLETTAFPDLPDPSFGSIPGVAGLCNSSIRRNKYLSFNNLTVGNRYYAIFIHATYPNSATRATLIEPEGFSDPVSFGVDGADSILSAGIRRFGFVATATDHHFLITCPDTNGSYLTGMVCLESV